MNHRDRLLLAVTIANWQAALTHIEVADSTRVINPRPFATLGRLRSERSDLCLRWSRMHGEVLFSVEDIPRLVAEAQAAVTTHKAEIDDLLIGTKE